MQSKAANSHNPAAMSFAIILIAAAALIYLFADSLSGKTRHQNQVYNYAPTSMDQTQTDVRLNEHLRELNQEIETQRFHRQLENQLSIPKVGALVPIPKSKTSEPLPLDPLPAENTGSNSRQEKHWITPDEVVQSELIERRLDSEYLKQYRKEYIRQFIQNAQERGWHVEVDDSGTVTKAVPLDDTGFSH